MKKIKYFIFITLVATIFIFSACSRQGETDLTPIVSQDEATCISDGGKFLKETSECVGISEIQCTNLGGNYNECASACRHETDKTKPCTLQCVQVCDLTEKYINKESCSEMGGKFEKAPKTGIYYCNEKTTDFGSSCANSNECQGHCLVDKNTNNGYCSEYKQAFGCFEILERGEPVTICID